MERGRLAGLDGLRGIAALAVVVFHVVQQKDGRGFLAVDFFFMLSGYVMARTYEARLVTAQASLAFIRARIRRLYPTYFIGSLLSLPWLIGKAGIGGLLVGALNLLLIPTPPGDGQLYILNVPAWSILFELVLNVIHAGLLWRLGQRALVWVIALLVPMLAWWASVYGLDVVAKGPWLLPVLTRALLPYCLGVLLYRRWQDVPPMRVPAVMTWGLMPLWFFAAPLLAPDGWWLDIAFVLVACPLLIAGGLIHGRGSRLAVLAGALSFPLYAIHGGVILELRPLGAPEWLQVLASVVAGFALMGVMAMLRRSALRRPASRPAVAG